MASEVLSGASNPTYTNNTGQNVRVVINYMAIGLISSIQQGISVSWGGVSATTQQITAIGRNLAYFAYLTKEQFQIQISGGAYGYGYGTAIANNAIGPMFPGGGSSTPTSGSSLAQAIAQALPTEIMLAPGQTFRAACGAYNIVIIPEEG